MNEFKDAASFYAFRVIKAYKDKDPNHVTWANTYLALLGELVTYVKKWHTTGLAWNPKGGDASAAKASAPATPSAASSAGPPPPPAPTAAQLEALSSPKTSANPAANLMNELAKGTSGLRKVDKSEMTHKNPELRATSVVKADAIKSTGIS